MWVGMLVEVYSQVHQVQECWGPQRRLREDMGSQLAEAETGSSVGIRQLSRQDVSAISNLRSVRDFVRPQAYFRRCQFLQPFAQQASHGAPLASS
jgi:hypothetical protein